MKSQQEAYNLQEVLSGSSSITIYRTSTLLSPPSHYTHEGKQIMQEIWPQEEKSFQAERKEN